MIEAICQGSLLDAVGSWIWTALSHPMARAFLTASTTRSGPIERTVNSVPSPSFSRSWTACSTAYSSYSFIRHARSPPSYQTPPASGLKRDSISGTCLMHTSNFMQTSLIYCALISNFSESNCKFQNRFNKTFLRIYMNPVACPCNRCNLCVRVFAPYGGFIFFKNIIGQFSSYK